MSDTTLYVFGLCCAVLAIVLGLVALVAMIIQDLS